MTSEEITWTKEKPTVEGWYWYRESHATQVIEISKSKASGEWLAEFAGSEMCQMLKYMECEFAGPIPQPIEPQAEAK